MKPRLLPLQEKLDNLVAERQRIEMSDDRAYTNGRLSSIMDEIRATKALMGRVESFEEVAALPLHIKVSLIHPLALLPNFASDGAAGADLHACMDESRIIDPGERVLIPTGVILEIPPGYEGQIRSRSGIALKSGVIVLNAPGTIDSDYRGEVHVLLVNHSWKAATINPQDRIAQLVVAPVLRPTFVVADDLSSTSRGDGGFGSTGVSALPI